MTAKLMLAIFLTSYALGSTVYEAFSRNLSIVAIAITIACAVSGTFLLWRTAEEQLPSE
jgi:hypothetical protein